MLRNRYYRCLKGNRGCCSDLLITNSQLLIFVTDLNDYHHIINTILQTRLDKSEPKERIYRNSKIVDIEL